MRIEVSREEILLDTGGGLKKAAHFFLEDSGGLDEPFILHNVDVISTIDLRRMVQFHAENQALATLAVQDRETSRYLLFDEQLQLCGRRSAPENNEIVRPSQKLQPLAFSGIHVISPRLLTMITEDGRILHHHHLFALSRPTRKHPGFRADQYAWRDLGRPDDLLKAADEMKK